MSFPIEDLQGFAAAAQSLKLYRRADLRDDVSDKSLIGKLYVDPLQHSAVLETMLRDNTTFLVGRKGTGKSTIFQRTQYELRNRENAISAYVDIKTVFEASEVDTSILPSSVQNSGILAMDDVRKVLLYRSFIKAVFEDIKSELKLHVSSSAFNKILEKLGLKRSDISGSIDDLLEGAFGMEETDITGWRSVNVKSENSGENTSRATAQVGAKLAASKAGLSLDMSLSETAERSNSSSSNYADEYSAYLLKSLNINKVIQDLQGILGSIGIKKLFIMIDDFSELPEEAMKIFVDTVLAPLNNWSNELIKFKVAAYPGRIYLGKIDPTKIDEIYLDMFRLYGDKDVATMEEKATDFTRRLIESRFNHFLGKSFSTFCDSDFQSVLKELFFASMANPRILGHILTNLRDSVTAYGNLIGIRTVRDASSKYYGEKVSTFFGIQKFALESFSEKASIFSLKELLESLIERARILRDYKESRVTREIIGRTPSSHFYVVKSLESALRTLELNFFLTLYYEQKDRDGNAVLVFALNHGLCQRHSITFGRPTGHREHRLYFVERIFDYTQIVRAFLETNQEIKCDNPECGAVHGLDKLEGLMMYGMLCPTCRRGKCEVINLSKKYEAVIRSVDPSLLLPTTELGILDALFTENRRMVASEIAGELDCSYQLVGKRARNLADRGLVSREKNEMNRRVFEITGEARSEYFEGNNERQLDITDES